MPHVSFDWTVNLGTIIQVVILILALGKMLRRLLQGIEIRMKAMEDRVDLMWAWIVIQMTPDQREQYRTWVMTQNRALGKTQFQVPE